MKRKRRRQSAASAAEHAAARRPSELRIIGGRLRGRKLLYSGRFDTRPMKDRVREATFNLIGPAVRGTHAIDLFAGTGALGFEAISRGATSATLIERHVPTARVISDNAAQLDLAELTNVVTANSLVWIYQQPQLPTQPWTVFCSPPFDLYVEERAEMLALIDWACRAAPPGSNIVVEADARFDFHQLPQAERWNVRTYPPAVVGVLRIAEDD